MTQDQLAPAAAGESRNLRTRIIAALVLAPAAIGIAWAGGPLWIGLVTLAAIGMYVEWLTIVGAAREKQIVAAGIAALILSGLSLALGYGAFSLVVLVIGAATVAAVSRRLRLWSVAGFCYAAAAAFASAQVRLDEAYGFVALIFVMLVVWAADIGGYFAGRGIGGPKLWPRVSPKKTWAGAIGGFAGGLVVAAGFAAVGIGKLTPLLLLAAFLSVVSQSGDLFESAVKRRFGVKDSSQIIPGHGGLLDRLDGFVAAIVVAALFGFLRGDANGIGHALMVW
ncbi:MULTISPECIES: phosphatidate cytidylyltransferase [unclassified Nitrobacter]|uniref:phosphatidate cytidylyltransferase n=1 Tax=unclassified Nitrobacter TaxID=2620411 RepID=UPI00092631BD|nr:MULTISPECIES: phosphatidate cytidylyltransferase [unclassified Nitrobacter]MBN9147340.1 phosphatidate cytidylyltransferase [Nitrobacter sp.]OJV00008.1 MAG: phosphatidate cytidylyltransferase [Nitrobacter sp. 62-23]